MAVSTTQRVVEYADRAADQHVPQRRRRIHEIKPFMREAPLTALTTRTGGRTNAGHKYYFSEQPYNARNGVSLDVYTDVGLGNAYVSGGVAGSVYYIAMTVANAGIIGKQDALLITNSDFEKLPVRVLDVTLNTDTTTYVTIALMEADSSAILADATPRFTITGSSENEVAELPDAKFEEPDEFWNYTMAMAESAEVSHREANSADAHDPSLKKRAKQQAFMRLSTNREMMRFLGQRGKSGSKTFSRGIYHWLKAECSAQIWNYKTDTTLVTAGSSWLNGGMKFLRDICLVTARYSESTKKIVFAGDLAVNAINEAALHSSQYTIKQGETVHGTQFTTVLGLRMPMTFIVHPMFTTNPALQYSACITEPHLIKTVTHKGRGLTWVPWGGKKADGYTWISADKSGWFIDEGIEIDNFKAFGWVDNIGIDNNQ
jgi:hypothetical protein